MITSRVLAALAAAALATHWAEAQVTPPDLAQVTLLGLPASYPIADAGFAAFLVDESDHGVADLNGDGDSADEVLFVHDASSGQTSNLGFAVDHVAMAMGAGLLFFEVSEEANAGLDLNGDGDAQDHVLHVRDLHAGTTTNLGCVSAGALALGEGVLAFTVQEGADGVADLNGDGDTGEAVLQCYVVQSGALVNAGLACDASSSLLLHEGLVLLGVPESQQGSVDLNGDADTQDSVLHAFDATLGTSVNLGRAISGLQPLPGAVVTAVRESDQGADLNNDGDSTDAVLHTIDLNTGAAANLALAGTAVPAGSFLAVEVYELAQGAVDLNGDGDVADAVLHVLNPATGAVLNLGLASSFVYAAGQRIGFAVREADQGGTDLNGDGDTKDRVFHAHDPLQGITRNLGLVGTVPWLHGSRLLMSVDEDHQGSGDLNGDGDTGDRVLFEHDFATGTTQNLGLAGSWGATSALLLINESESGADLNGDSDTGDWVLHVRDPVSGSIQNLGLAGSNGQSEQGLLTARVRELGQGGTDLNGDGDHTDEIACVIEPRFPFGLQTDGDSLSVSAGGEHGLELDAGSAHGGELYLLLGSLTGTSPGLPLGALQLPLNPDNYFVATLLSPNAPPLVDFLGVLNSMGEARARFVLPPASPPVLVGLTAHHAFAAFDLAAGSLTFVSNPAPLRFTP